MAGPTCPETDHWHRVAVAKGDGLVRNDVRRVTRGRGQQQQRAPNHRRVHGGGGARSVPDNKRKNVRGLQLQTPQEGRDTCRSST